MSNIANALGDLMKGAKLNAASLSKQSGVGEGQISRIHNGVQSWISPTDMIAFANAFAPQGGAAMKKVHAQLLYAHLQDLLTGPGAAYIEMQLLISPRPMVLHDRATVSDPVLPPKTKQDLDLIARHATKRNVRELIQTIARMCRNEPLPPAQS